MKTLLVVAHPRVTSLTHAAARAFADAATARGHEIEVADLMTEGFDPALQEPDEPDWGTPGKLFSAAVLAEMTRIERNQATVLVYPVWWWSMPAVLKGWIDRVWNQGWAYDGGTYPHRRVWSIGIAGNSAETYAGRGYDAALRVQVEVGILRYCGVSETRHVVLHDSLDGRDASDAVVAGAGLLGQEF